MSYQQPFKGERPIKYITLEGNIGAGKSTILKELAEKLGATPVEEGIEDDETFKQLVADIGEGVKGAGEKLNIYLANKRAAQIKEFKKGGLYLMERSIISSFLFAMADKSSEEALNEIGKLTIKSQPPVLSVYYRTPANECMKRIRKRGRKGEDGIQMRYLLRIEKQHNDWAEVGEELHRVLVVDDGEMPVGQLAELVKTKIEMVEEFTTLYEKHSRFKK